MIWSGHGRGLSFSFPLGRRKENEKKIGGMGTCSRRGRAGGVLLAACRRGGQVRAGRRGGRRAAHHRPRGGVAAAVHDLQPHPGRGGVLGRIPGEPAAAGAGRRGPGRRRGVLGGVLEHRLDLGDVDDVDVQGPRAGRLGRRRRRSVSPARSAGRPTASSSTARRRPAAAARRSRCSGRSRRPGRPAGPPSGWHTLPPPAACPRHRWTGRRAACADGS